MGNTTTLITVPLLAVGFPGFGGVGLGFFRVLLVCFLFHGLGFSLLLINSEFLKRTRQYCSFPGGGATAVKSHWLSESYRRGAGTFQRFWPHVRAWEFPVGSKWPSEFSLALLSSSLGTRALGLGGQWEPCSPEKPFFHSFIQPCSKQGFLTSFSLCNG